jgi:hypothetical protein
MPAPANGVWDGSGRKKPKRIGVADLWADLNYSRELGSSMTRAVGCPYFRRAFGWCADRRPWRADRIGRRRVPFARPDVRHRLQRAAAVSLNLLTSLVTLTFALGATLGGLLTIQTEALPGKLTVAARPETPEVDCGQSGAIPEAWRVDIQDDGREPSSLSRYIARLCP